MRKRLLFTMLGIVMAINVFAEANYVYHERTTNNPGCGSNNYVSKLAPTAADAVTLAFKVEYRFYTDQARIYYTTDGTTPSGNFGVPNGTTQIATAFFNGAGGCTFTSGPNIVDVVVGTIPAQVAGTTVKYIVSAWNSGGGSEIFANGPGSPCSCGTPTNNASLATVFTYSVSGILPITFGPITATQNVNNATINIAWQVLSQSNIYTLEVEKSTDGVNFKVANNQLNTGAKQYNWLDATPANGNNYYRIKASGKDGDITYSAIVRVGMIGAQSSFGIYPNPITNNSIHLQLNNLPKDTYKINIYNATGQAVYTTTIVYNGGGGDYTIMHPNLAKGVYQLSARGGQTKYLAELVIQ